MQNKRVNIFSSAPITYYGGGERLMVMILSYLDEHDFEPSLIDNIQPNAEKRIGENELFDIANAKISHEKFLRYGFPKFLFQDLPDYNRIFESSAGVSMSFIWRIPARKYLLKIRNQQSKMVFCIHGIALERFRFTHPLIMIHQVYTRFQMFRLAKFLRGTIYAQVLDNHILNFLVKRGADRSNIFTIENGFNDKISLIRNDDEFRVIFIGRIENLQKGIKRLKKTAIHLQKSNSSIKVVIIGSGRDNRVLSALPNNCEFMKNVNDEIKKRELQRANLMIITSNLEPFSRVAIEGLQAGLPLVSTPVSGPASIIKKNESFGVISTFNPRNLANDIVRYYQTWREDKRAYFELRKDISLTAAKIFKQEVMLDNYGKMLKDVISRE